MVTAKKAAVKPQPKRTAVKPQAEEFRMPMEVKEWIDQADSRIRHLTTKLARLEEENVKLRRANKLMEARVMNTSFE
jgi:hypothetical protein